MFRLQVEREMAGLTRARLGALANVHPSEIGKIESGRLKPYGCQIERIADALGVSPQGLLAEVDLQGIEKRRPIR